MRPAWRGVRLRSSIRKRLKPSAWMRKSALAIAAPHDAGRALRCLAQRDVRRHEYLSRQAFQPVLRNASDRSLRKRIVELARSEESVAGALGAPLPLEAERAEIDLEVTEVRRRRLHAIARAQLDDTLVFRLAHRQIRRQRQIGRALRDGDDFRRASVQFVVESEALRVIGEGCHWCCLRREGSKRSTKM